MSKRIRIELGDNATLVIIMLIGILFVWGSAILGGQ